MIIIIFGGTGYLAKALIPWLLNKYQPESIRLFARNDWRMARILRENNDLYTYKRLRPLIGDVCDRERVMSVIGGCDLAIDAHAMKRIEIANFCPQEAIKVNVLGVMNCMDAAIQKKIPKFIFTSTDKAYHAENLYGKTKAVSESMIIERARVLGNTTPTMVVTRYGNCISSTGACLPYWINLAKEGKPMPLTDKGMTRFLLTKRMALDVIGEAIDRGRQGEIIIPKDLVSVSMVDAANWINEYFGKNSEIKIIGPFPGEKIDEELDEGVNSSDYLINKAGFYDLLKEEGLL